MEQIKEKFFRKNKQYSAVNPRYFQKASKHGKKFLDSKIFIFLIIKCQLL